MSQFRVFLDLGGIWSHYVRCRGDRAGLPKAPNLSETTESQQDLNRKSWELLNLQADTMLKLAQTQTEPWKMAMGGAGAGAALIAATLAFAKIFF